MTDLEVIGVLALFGLSLWGLTALCGWLQGVKA